MSLNKRQPIFDLARKLDKVKVNTAKNKTKDDLNKNDNKSDIATFLKSIDNILVEKVPTYDYSDLKLFQDQYSENKCLKINNESLISLKRLRRSIMASTDSGEHFLKSTSNVTSSLTIKGPDFDGTEAEINLVIPSVLKNPPKFNQLTMYPLAPNRTEFMYNHPYQYLPTFSYGSFINQKEIQTDTLMINIYNEIHRQIVNVQAQMRLSTMLRQLEAMLLTVDIYLNKQDHVFRKLYNELLIKNGKQRIIEVRTPKSVEFHYKDVDAPSTLPIVYFMITQAITCLVTGNANEIMITRLLNHQLTYFNGAYQDSKLRDKDLSSLWVEKAFCNMKAVPSIEWSIDYKPIRQYDKHLTPEISKLINDEFNVNYLTVSESAKQMIDYALKNSKDYDSMRKIFTFMRYVGNEGMFLDSIDDQVLEKAIQPQLVEKAIERSKITKRIVGADHLNVPIQTRSVNKTCRLVMAQANTYLDSVRKEVAGIDFREKWHEALTTSSAGAKIPPEVLEQMGLKLLGSASRYLMEAAMGKEYRSLKRFLESVKLYLLGKRTQNRRRTRRILMVPNEVLFVGMPIYIIAKMVTHFNNDTPLGKTKGNMFDMGDLLYYTGRPNVLISSTDIIGMDASMQDGVKEILFEFVFNAATTVAQRLYGPFKTRLANVCDANGKVTNEKVNAVQLTVGYYYHNYRNTAEYYSKVFQVVRQLRDSPFGSGLPFTTMNHTLVLNWIIRANMRVRIMKRERAVLAFTSASGDDVLNVYEGKTQDMLSHMNSDIKQITDLGFKVKGEFSEISGVFLQQFAVGGTYWGLPDRINFTAREKRTERLSLRDSSNELMALGMDMTHRIYDSRGLKLLLFMLLYFCVSKITYKIKSSKLSKIKRILQMTKLEWYITDLNTDNTRAKTSKGKQVRNISKKTRNKVDSALVTIYCPVMWLFHHEGGGFPPYPTERSDGTYTHDYSILSPRGQFLRRYFYDLSGINNLEKEFSVDFKLLDEYELLEAELLVELDLKDIHKIAVQAQADPVMVTKLAAGIELVANGDKFIRSRRAYKTLALKTPTKRGFVLPNQVVYGLKPYERIKQSLEQAGRIEADFYKRLTDKFLLTFTEFNFLNPSKSLERFFQTKKDRLHRHAITIITSPKDQKQHHIPYMSTFDIPLTNLLNHDNPEYNLVKHLGIMSSFRTELNYEIARVRGEFNRVLFDDPVFEQGLRIFLQDATQLDLFFESIQASNAMRQTLLLGFQAFAQYGNIIYQRSINPRALFMINDDPFSVKDLVIFRNEIIDINMYAFQLTVVYLWLLTNPSLLNGTDRYSITMR